jgi:hypothetical protein
MLISKTMAEPKTEYTCRYCEKSFRKESSLAVHLCEQKRRYQEQTETGVQLGLQAYLRFYEITQGSAKFKSFDDFAKSPYYKAFVKFGRHIQQIRAVNPARFIEWVIQQNKKIDQWCQEKIYLEYLHEYITKENVKDAVSRALEEALRWHELTGHPAQDFLRYGNGNSVCVAIINGRISPWVLYNTNSGNEFLTSINQHQLSMIWPVINADVWQKKFQDYVADAEYVRTVLEKEGW